jgi:hypothetical protein
MRSTAILAVKSEWDRITHYTRVVGLWQLLLLVVIGALSAGDLEVRHIVVRALSEAYLQVSVFVAATLAIFSILENRCKLDTVTFLQRHRRWQVPVAAVMGALPGCGGAIIVMTQYIRGVNGFGAVVAVLTATMGDAAFLLLAREPLTGLAIFMAGMIVGTISGYVVECIHGADFFRVQNVHVSSPPAGDVPSRTGARHTFPVVSPHCAGSGVGCCPGVTGRCRGVAW